MEAIETPKTCGRADIHTIKVPYDHDQAGWPDVFLSFKKSPAMKKSSRSRFPEVQVEPEYRLSHSDRGSQYASNDYQSLLRANGISCCMSRKGNCWDNSVVESFFGSLKQEHVFFCNFATREEARRSVFERIEGFYNRQRLHSTLGYRSPEEYERSAA